MVKKNRRVGYSTKEGIIIWYLLPCKEQEEQKILASCRKYLSDRAIRDAFVLTYDQMRRYQGIWHMEKKLLFPANVLLESENEEILKGELRRQKRLVEGISWNILKLDWTENVGGLLRLDLEEEAFLRSLCGEQKHIGMSKGIICKGVTQVFEGPLRGREAQICKIDRHKRLARLEAQKGRKNLRYILAGLEIVERV